MRSNGFWGCRGDGVLNRRQFLAIAAALPLGAVWQSTPGPRLAPGTPRSPERMALIEAFEARTVGLAELFEARTHLTSTGWEMPYRLFRPSAAGRLPLVLYLHGAGGSGTDNRKQLEGSSVPGAFLWVLPEVQEFQPCYVLAPQTDRRWLRYQAPSPDRSPRLVPGFGDGAAAAMEVLTIVMNEFPIDADGVYVTGNSMGGGGVWHLVAHRGEFFSAAIACCASPTAETGAENPRVPVWNFHGDADTSVPVEMSRERIQARKEAGGTPVYTEYPGVGHDVARWAYTEPALPQWMFEHHR